MAYFPYVTFVSVVSFNDVTIPPFAFVDGEECLNFMFEWQEQYLTSERKLTREILFLPLEHKIHIFEPPCNILYLLYGEECFTGN